MNAKLYEKGLDKYIFNWEASKADNQPGKCYVPDPWPTLREMIESGKNIMFLHHRGYADHGVVDEFYFRGNVYGDENLYKGYEARNIEALCRLKRVWSPPQERQQDVPYHLFLAECDPDWNSNAGNHVAASRNNDGRKHYQLAKHYETELFHTPRAVNFIIVDYFGATACGLLPISVVDACNRLNYERIGSSWENSECFWELYPYEFDNSKVEYLRQIPAITAEVESAAQDVENERPLAGHEIRGEIVSTSYDEVGDWKRLPEWALDDDFFTNARAAEWDHSYAWGVDLGARKNIDEIAISWHDPHGRPRYEVYVSNDDNRFADSISQAELNEDIGWTIVLNVADETGSVKPWDKRAFNNIADDGCRYMKIRAFGNPSIAPWIDELRLYGPAD
jgi:hypothetical protein